MSPIGMNQLLALLLPAIALAFPAMAQSPRGFPADWGKQLRQWEEKARAIPEAARIRGYMQRMSAEPHHAGSPGSRAVAEYAAGLLKEWGLDTRIEIFEALLPYPATRVVEMVEPVRFRAKLQEPVVAGDPDSGDSRQLPTYNAYSGSGDVTAPLIYVNYGVPEDYAHLKRMGVDVKGKIVIARYGKSWRGTKPKVAAENGAVGCIIYSDPRDDGYFQGDVYPAGPFRPPHGVQRGSVMDMPIMVGDPLSPGWASEPGSKRLKLEDAATLMKIPVLPMSYDDAAELLKELRGPVAPENWRGALGLTYHIGPGPAKVRIKLDFDNTTKPLYNVIATIPGAEFPEQRVLYGNHHDAWVNGASDPLSGASALLETARTLAALRKAGWTPRRTVQLALWDGEEFGLIGSTEWVEKHQADLEKNLVAYVNSDATGKGRIGASGSHSLESFVKELLSEVNDPVSGKPLIEGSRAGRDAGPGGDPFRLGSLGAGSDYVAFIDHAGIASLNFGFSGDAGGGVYHSIYDSFFWYTRFSDGDFTYGRTFSGLNTMLLMRLADSALVPFEFTALHKTVERFWGEIAKDAGRDLEKLDARELQSELGKLAASAKAFEAEYQAALKRWNTPTKEKVAAANAAIYRTERTLLAHAGLPGRPWYRHQLYAPGQYTGYSVKTLPGIREAAEAKRWQEANAQAKEVSKALRALSAELARITALLRGL
ncbi:MAG: M28 family peptidase [Acidobacteria bacterium]|nr:M28 family peptidase [Acidobacteriota bacterium]